MVGLLYIQAAQVSSPQPHSQYFVVCGIANGAVEVLTELLEYTLFLCCVLCSNGLRNFSSGIDMGNQILPRYAYVQIMIFVVPQHPILLSLMTHHNFK